MGAEKVGCGRLNLLAVARKLTGSILLLKSKSCHHLPPILVGQHQTFLKCQLDVGSLQLAGKKILFP
jgi:hypothetical protein